MVVIGNSYGDGIKILAFFFKHLPPVVKEFCAWKLLESRSGHAVIDIAKMRHDCVFLWRSGIVMNVIFPFSATANCCDIQFIAGRHVTQATDGKAWDNGKCGGTGGCHLYKLASRQFG